MNRPNVDPLAAFHALENWQPFVLLESQSLHSTIGRRSLLGLGPRLVYECTRPGKDTAASLQQSLDHWLNSRCGDSGDGYGVLFAMFAYEWKNVLEMRGHKPNSKIGIGLCPRISDFPLVSLIGCRNLVVWDHEVGSLEVFGEEAVEIRRVLENAGTGIIGDMTQFSILNWDRVPNYRNAGTGNMGTRSQLKKPNWVMSPYFPMSRISWHSDMSRDEFLARVKKIQSYIAAGDIYQANLSQRFSSQTDASGLEIYAAARSINPSPFGGYFRLGDWELISCSPERLLSKVGNVLQTRPIAGTKPRGAGEHSDQNYRSELLMSPKERAEHIMLVDLERNDLGRICIKGSVRVDEMMEVEKYSHVQHIVSNVRGISRPALTFTEALQAVFPGGTITGVPKIRCMEILDELESSPRGPYTGSFGYIDSRGDYDLNIVIRTLAKKGDSIFLQTGAGIVADSDPAAEYQETLDKAKAMILAVEATSARIPAAR